MKKRGGIFIRFFEFILLTLIVSLFLISGIVSVYAEEFSINDGTVILDSLKIGQYLEKGLIYQNKDAYTKDINVELQGPITKSVIIDEYNFSVGPRKTYTLNMTIIGNNEVGEYDGTIEFSNEYFKIIPILIQFFDEGYVTARAMTIDTKVLTPIVWTGSDFKFNTELENQLDYLNYTVGLKYLIIEHKVNNENENISKNIGDDIDEDVSGIKIFEYYEEITLVDRITLTKEIPIDKVPKGNYDLIVYANFLNFTSRTQGMFTVKTRFLNKIIFWKIRVWMLILYLISIILGIVGYKFTIYKINKRKHFMVDIDYETLPQGGRRDIKVGKITETNIDSFIDMDKLTVHTIVAGSTGSGKSVTAQDIVEECLNKNISVIVFDPTAQWTGMLRKQTDKNQLKQFRKFNLKEKDAKAFRGNVRVIKDGRQNIDPLKFAKPGEVQIFTANRLEPKDYDLFIANTIRNIFKRKNTESRHLEYLLIFDEIHRILPTFGGSGDGFLQIERGCREFRKWGIGLVLISQVLQDFVGDVKANINTQIQMKTRDESDLKTVNSNFGEDYVHKLIKAPVGTGIIQNSAWNKGIPYFVTFRPTLHSIERLTDNEIDEYDHFNLIIDSLDDQLVELENLGQDTTDLKIELNLIKNKLTSGNTKILKIYLDELTPRFEQMWGRMGMEIPEIGSLDLIDDKTMKEELEIAKKLRKEYIQNIKKVNEEEKENKIDNDKDNDNKDLYEKTIEPEVARSNWESIGTLKKQAFESISRNELDRAKELLDEIKRLKIANIKEKDRKVVVKEVEEKIDENSL